MNSKSAAIGLFATLLACALLGSAYADEYDVEFNNRWFNVAGGNNFVGKMRITGAINATATPPIGDITITVTEGMKSKVIAEIKSHMVLRILLIESTGHVALGLLVDYKLLDTGERGESRLDLKLPYAGNPPNTLLTGTGQAKFSMNTSTGLLSFEATGPDIKIGTIRKRAPPRR
jgi:hypothetical protein